MAGKAPILSPEVQRFQEEFLADRARHRAAMIESAGYPAPLPLTSPSPPPALRDEDQLAAGILARLNGGVPTTADERLYLRRKLFAVTSEDCYVPIPIRAMPSKDRLLLDARLLAIEHAARSAP